MKAPFGYIGGKNRLAKRIIGLIPEHRTYVELFSGGAKVLFQKTASRNEVLNDLDNEITNFFRICQHHDGELIRHLRYHVASRKWFDLLLHHTDSANLTDIQRAARFFYLQKLCYGGRVLGKSFGYAVEGKPRFDAAEIPEIIQRTCARLARVQIESLPYEDVLYRYDRKETFFYCDPPYYGLPKYAFNFSHRDYELLRDHLIKIKGKFLLSINDVPEIREIFSQFRIERVNIRYSVQKTTKVASELLIRNYSLRPCALG